MINDEVKEQVDSKIEKGKQGILTVIFGRSTVIFALLLLQIGVFFGIYHWLQSYSAYYMGVTYVIALGFIVYLINRRVNPAFTLVWVIIVALVPVFGICLYLFVELQWDTRWIDNKLTTMHKALKPFWRQNEVVRFNLSREDEATANLAKYVCNWGGFPVYQNTAIKYFSCGEEKFEELCFQLRRAQKFIFMEYFIVAKGHMWNTILQILKEKVEEGVEVRFMYDGTCSLSLLPVNYPKKLKEMNIQCHVFSPIRPALSTHQNNRDHRKIVVIDGLVGFTGGINLADEYINRKERFGYWKDTAVMLEGEAVRSLTLMFLEMWNVTKDPRNDRITQYLEIPQLRIPAEGDGYVLPYGDSPMDSEQVGESVYIDILYSAKRYVHIMTPYLILDHEMITALTYAAQRGVEVVIIMPHIPDKWYAFLLAKTYYPELLEAGVHIYEFTPGFVHAKVFVSDDEKAVVGTINLDYRSLYLHFECGVFMYRNSEIKHIEQDVQNTLEKCQKIDISYVKKQKPHKKLMGRVLRLIAPLM